MNFNTKDLTVTAVLAAVICILGPLSVPIGIIPVSLTPLGIYLAIYILGQKKGTIAVCVYILLGLAGMPVFAGFTGGPQKLFGPTGGYIVAYILTALIAGYAVEHFYDNVFLQFAGMFLGLIVLYVIGTIWLAFQAHMTFLQALSAGVLPFVIFDIMKIVLALFVGRAVRSRLVSSGAFETGTTRM